MLTIQAVHQMGHEVHCNPFHGNEALLLKLVFIIYLVITYLIAPMCHSMRE